MNYYPHHIGDYRRDTAHLTLLEHGVYRQLLDLYYLEESPIPLETQWVTRRLSARTQEEIAAVQSVLNDFFSRLDDGWHHRRCDMEIREYQAQAEKNRANGRKGGRPKANKDATNNPVGFESVNSGMPDQTQINPNQEPITNNQEPIKDTAREVADLASKACVVVKLHGIGNVNPGHPKLLEVLLDGATAIDFIEATKVSVNAGKGFAYMLGVVAGRLKEARQAPAKLKDRSMTFAERDRENGIRRWEEMTGEVHPERARDVTTVTMQEIVSNPLGIGHDN